MTGYNTSPTYVTGDIVQDTDTKVEFAALKAAFDAATGHTHGGSVGEGAPIPSDPLKADLASPTFTGDPKAPTPSASDNDTSIATTAFVQTEIASKADLASPTFTGDPKAPTATPGDSDTSIATTAFVDAAITAAHSVTPTIQTFTSNGTWNRPAGCLYVVAEVVGPGGGAGGSNDSLKGGGGAGAGGYSRVTVDVTGISSVSVTIGTGGTGGVGNASGVVGTGNSTFGTHASASPGDRGLGSTVGAQKESEGGVGSLGDINMRGGPGEMPKSGDARSGTGGNSYFGGGGAASSIATTGGDAGFANSGGGGSGALGVSTTGGAGADGIVIVTEYY